MDDGVTPPGLAQETTALLLAQVGTQSAYRFAQRLFELELLPPHAGVLKVLETDSGISQRALSRLLSMLPTRVVVLVNELEKRGLVERRPEACRADGSSDSRPLDFSVLPAFPAPG